MTRSRIWIASAVRFLLIRFTAASARIGRIVERRLVDLREIEHRARIVADLHGACGRQLQQLAIVRVGSQGEVEIFERFGMMPFAAVGERNRAIDARQLGMRLEHLHVFGARLGILARLEHRLGFREQLGTVVALQRHRQRRILAVADCQVLPHGDEILRVDLNPPLARP